MTEIRVPTLGESVTEATIGKWFKKPGDAVAVDEPLVELETDKVTIEVPAPAARPTGQPEQKSSTTTPINAGPEQPQPRPAPKPDAPLAPSVRKIAAETGVDPGKVDGSSKDGRV